MPIQTFTVARDEIVDHFVTAWSAQTPPVPVLLYGDKHTDLPDNDAWARLTVNHNLADAVTVGGETGNRRFRRFGLVQVQIFTPSNMGLAIADTFAKVALDAFEGQKTQEDRVHFRNVRMIEVGQDGAWFQTNVIADFDYDEVK